TGRGLDGRRPAFGSPGSAGRAGPRSPEAEPGSRPDSSAQAPAAPAVHRWTARSGSGPPVEEATAAWTRPSAVGSSWTVRHAREAAAAATRQAQIRLLTATWATTGPTATRVHTLAAP